MLEQKEKGMKIGVVVKGLSARRLFLQPWYYLCSFHEALTRGGYDTTLITDLPDPPVPYARYCARLRTFPSGVTEELSAMIDVMGIDLLVWPWTPADLFFAKSVFSLGKRIVFLVTAPRYEIRELLPLLSTGGDRAAIMSLFLGSLVPVQMIERYFDHPSVKAVIFQSEGALCRHVRTNKRRQKHMVLMPPLREEFVRAMQGVPGSGGIIGKNRLWIVYMGPPEISRGIGTLLRACRVLLDRGERVSVTMFLRKDHDGFVIRQKEIERLIMKYALNSSVSIDASGEYARMIASVRSATVICLPFIGLYADMPIGVLEALATGRPVITTTVTGMQECGARACLIIPPGDVQALSEAIIRAKQTGSVRVDKFFYDKEKFVTDVCKRMELLTYEH